MTTSGIMRAGGNKKGVFTRDRQPKQVAHAVRHRWRGSRFRLSPQIPQPGLRRSSRRSQPSHWWRRRSCTRRSRTAVLKCTSSSMGIGRSGSPIDFARIWMRHACARPRGAEECLGGGRTGRVVAVVARDEISLLDQVDEVLAVDLVLEEVVVDVPIIGSR